MSKLLQVADDIDRLERLERCRSDLWYLATEILDYGWDPDAGTGVFKGKGLTERLHKPLCEWYDRRRDQHFCGTWISRWHHKTTLAVCQIVQDILIEPTIALFYFHAVDDEASKVVGEVAQHFLKNKKLRSLDPVGVYPADHPEKAGKSYRIFPHPNSKRWATADRFTVNRGDFYSRFPTLLGKGAGSEITGAHANKAYLDDIIGKRAIEDNLIPKIAHWVQNTVIPVVDDLQLRVTGTPWSDWGPYVEWQSDDQWNTVVIPGSTVEQLETVDWSQDKLHLTPDYTLKNPAYGPLDHRPRAIKKLQILQKQMKSNFGPQIMCDPSPEEEKPWEAAACEHYITMQELNRKGRGVIFVLSDPAPAQVGSATGVGEQKRGDGTKDDWAYAVGMIRVEGQRQELILLDGSYSKDWGRDAGMDEACRLMKKWNTNKVGHESYGGLIADYDLDMKRAVRRNSVPSYLPLKFKDSYKANQKNLRFKGLADRARQYEFLICKDTVSPDYLEKFLYQARNWKPLPKSRNSLRFDDVADVVSRLTDSALQEFAPQPLFGHGVFEQMEEWDDAQTETAHRSRYCAI